MSKDLTQKLDASLEDKVDRLITIAQSMDSRLDNVETNLETRLESLETRLASLETKVDERLKKTRPMWEVVQTQLAELRESQERLRGEMEKGFRLVDWRVNQLSTTSFTGTTGTLRSASRKLKSNQAKTRSGRSA